MALTPRACFSVLFFYAFVFVFFRPVTHGVSLFLIVCRPCWVTGGLATTITAGFTRWARVLRRVLGLGLVVLVTFGSLWAPFCFSAASADGSGCFASLGQVRVNRGYLCMHVPAQTSKAAQVPIICVCLKLWNATRVLSSRCHSRFGIGSKFRLLLPHWRAGSVSHRFQTPLVTRSPRP